MYHHKILYHKVLQIVLQSKQTQHTHKLKSIMIRPCTCKVHVQYTQHANETHLDYILTGEGESRLEEMGP